MRRLPEAMPLRRRPSFCSAAALALCLAAAVAAAAPRAAEAQILTLVSNTTDWRQSTVSDTTAAANANPWLGVPVASQPATATYTIVPTAQDTAAAPIAGATDLLSQNGIRFFRSTFTLPAFSNLTTDLRINVDNDVDIYINGNRLAQIGTLSGANFANPPLHVFVDAAGVVTNGAGGDQAFTVVAPSFPNSNFNAGSNEIILAVRNLAGGDSGGFTFRMDLNFTVVEAGAAPEPGSLALLAAAAIPAVGMAVRRRRRRQP